MKAIATKIDHFAINVGALAVSGLFEKPLEYGLKCFEDRNGDFIIIDSDNDGEIVKCSAKFSTALNLDLLEPGFIPVPASTIKWGDKIINVPAFHVEQYLASVDSEGKAIRTTTGKPKNNISQEEAAEACIKAGRVIQRGSQALAISLNVMSVPENWTGGEVGKGELYRGLHRGTVSGPVTNDYVSPHENERRYLYLTNGHKIYDWSGHLWEHMFDDIHGDENGVVKGSIPADSPYLTSAPYPSMEKGMGYIYKGPLNLSGNALLRGGGLLGLGRRCRCVLSRRLRARLPRRQCRFPQHQDSLRSLISGPGRLRSSGPTSEDCKSGTSGRRRKFDVKTQCAWHSGKLPGPTLNSAPSLKNWHINRIGRAKKLSRIQCW